MVAQPRHGRKIAFSGVSLTMARPNRYDIPVMMELQDELEEILIRSDFLKEAPFSWIGIIFRYGLKNEDQPHYQRIDKKYRDLPLAIEIDTQELIESNRDELKQLFLNAALKCLIHAGRKYKRPIDALIELQKN